MMSSSACGALGGRRFSGFVIGSSVPRQFAFRSQTRLISTVRIQCARPLPPRKDLYALPGSARNYWWSSPKTPAAPKIEPEAVAQDATAVDPTLLQEPPSEVASLADPTALVDPSAAASLPLDGMSSAAADAVSDAAVAAASVPPPPLGYGDLAALGLGGWSPIGLCQVGIETLQVFSGMPWFWTIVTASVVSRAVLLPFAIMGLRNGAKMAPHQPEFLALREEVMAARSSGDMVKMNRAVVRQKLLYERIGVSMGGMFVPAVAQVPVTIGMFFAVKRLCDLPLEQLKYSGFALIPDLTMADPTWILPTLATAAINLQLTVSMKDMSATNPNAGHMINLFRGLTILGFFFMAQLPSGVLVYLLTTSAFMVVQTLLLRIPSVRKYLDIPAIPPKLEGASHSMLDSIKFARDAIRKKRLEAEENARKHTRR